MNLTINDLYELFNTKYEIWLNNSTIIHNVKIKRIYTSETGISRIEYENFDKNIFIEDFENIKEMRPVKEIVNNNLKYDDKHQVL
jgi:hypothetical protein